MKKQFFMKNQHMVDKCIGTEIHWMAGCDVTKTKKKKGKGKKKVNVVVKCDSFFNFFETVESDTSKKMVHQDDDEEEHDSEAEQMENDYDLGTTIRDDVIPLALEFYLGVIE